MGVDRQRRTLVAGHADTCANRAAVSHRSKYASSKRMAGRGKPQQKIVVACAAHDEAIEIMQPEMRAPNDAPRAGPREREVGLDRLREIAARTLGVARGRWHLCYQVCLGLK